MYNKDHEYLGFFVLNFTKKKTYRSTRNGLLNTDLDDVCIYDIKTNDDTLTLFLMIRGYSQEDVQTLADFIVENTRYENKFGRMLFKNATKTKTFYFKCNKTKSEEEEVKNYTTFKYSKKPSTVDDELISKTKKCLIIKDT